MVLEGQNGEVCKADHFTQRGWHVRMILDLMFWNLNDLAVNLKKKKKNV